MTKGYLLFAVDTPQVDYCLLAYACALSIKKTQPIGFNSVSVVTNTPEKFKQYNKKIFDEIINYDGPTGMDARSRAYDYTPYDETVLLDSDMLFLKPMDHLWDCMKDQDLYISRSPQTHRERKFQYGPLRHIFEKNQWQDVYSAWTYFKKSNTAKEFFDLAKDITDYPTEFINEFIPESVLDSMPTDEAFALALEILDIDLPKWDFPRITHMKHEVQFWNYEWYKQWNYDWDDYAYDWTYKLRFQLDQNDRVKLGVWEQAELLHYVKKDLMAEYIIERMERAL